MEATSAERERPRLGPEDGAARKRAAVELYARNEAALRRTARRYSLCADDAEDALQRGLEILLRKAPTDDPRELIKWTQTVVKHEALAIRRDRERILAGPSATAPEPDAEDWVATLPADSDGPPERAERREAIARSREALQALKPQELRALTLLAEGYSYAEIGEITGYSRTKINRCLAEGRERYRKLISRSEGGDRCAEMAPLISAFCDGEAGAEAVAELREHLRACGHCRATLRAYRAAPAAAAALAPMLPLDRSLLERLQDAVAGLTERFGGGGDSAAAQVAGGGAGATATSQVVAGGGGIAALAKAVVCVGAVGGTCIASGIVPAPLELGAAREQPALERRQLIASPTPTPEPEPARPAEQDPPGRKPEPEPAPESSPPPSPAEAPAESQPVPSEPAPTTAAAPVEYVPPPPPPPEPVAAPAPAPSPGGGSPAGEFGP